MTPCVYVEVLGVQEPSKSWQLAWTTLFIVFVCGWCSVCNKDSTGARKLKLVCNPMVEILEPRSWNRRTNWMLSYITYIHDGGPIYLNDICNNINNIHFSQVNDEVGWRRIISTTSHRERWNCKEMSPRNLSSSLHTSSYVPWIVSLKKSVRHDNFSLFGVFTEYTFYRTNLFSFINTFLLVI